MKIWQNLESSWWDFFRDEHHCKISKGNYLSIVNHRILTVPGNETEFPNFADWQIWGEKEREEEEKEMSNESKKKKDKEKEKRRSWQRSICVLNESELTEHLPSHVGSWVGKVANFLLALSHNFVPHYIYYFFILNFKTTVMLNILTLSFEKKKKTELELYFFFFTMVNLYDSQYNLKWFSFKRVNVQISMV